MKGSTIVWISVTAILGGSVAFFFYDQVQKGKGNQVSGNMLLGNMPQIGLEDKDTDMPSTINDLVKPINQSSAATFPLKMGSTGESVKKLQQFLNWNFYYTSSAPLTVDGQFGQQTKNAVAHMQVMPKPAHQDYLGYAVFSPDFREGEVTKEFYDKFIA